MIFGIPNDILCWAYETSDNLHVYIDEISNTGIVLTIKNTNKYRKECEYSNDYKLASKTLKNSSNSEKKVESIKIDDNTVKNIYNWENVYGELESGEYSFQTETTQLHIYITINFTIEENGKIKYDEPIYGLTNIL